MILFAGFPHKFDYAPRTFSERLIYVQFVSYFQGYLSLTTNGHKLLHERLRNNGTYDHNQEI